MWTEEGLKPIEQVEDGDLVYSSDQSAGEADLSGPELKRVTKTFERTADALVTVGFSDGTELALTPEHPVFVPGEGWVRAGMLQIGNAVQTRAGPVTVTELSLQTGSFPVYNLEVSETHTYFVTNGLVWVHNGCGRQSGRLGGPDHRRRVREVAGELRDQGHKIKHGGGGSEARVDIPDGNYRYPDIESTKDGQRYYHNIGDVDAAGNPVRRELPALGDLAKAGPTFFYPKYGGPHIRIR